MAGSALTHERLQLTILPPQTLVHFAEQETGQRKSPLASRKRPLPQAFQYISGAWISFLQLTECGDAGLQDLGEAFHFFGGVASGAERVAQLSRR
jgi:hypothetical protein